MNRRKWSVLLATGAMALGLSTAGVLSQAGASDAGKIPAGAKLDVATVAQDVPTLLPSGEMATINMQRDVYDEAHRQDAADPAPRGSAYEYRFNAEGKLARYALCTNAPMSSKEITQRRAAGQQVPDNATTGVCTPLAK